MQGCPSTPSLISKLLAYACIKSKFSRAHLSYRVAMAESPQEFQSNSSLSSAIRDSAAPMNLGSNKLAAHQINETNPNYAY